MRHRLALRDWNAKHSFQRRSGRMPCCPKGCGVSLMSDCRKKAPSFAGANAPQSCGGGAYAPDRLSDGTERFTDAFASWSCQRQDTTAIAAFRAPEFPSDSEDGATPLLSQSERRRTCVIPFRETSTRMRRRRRSERSSARSTL